MHTFVSIVVKFKSLCKAREKFIIDCQLARWCLRLGFWTLSTKIIWLLDGYGPAWYFHAHVSYVLIYFLIGVFGRYGWSRGCAFLGLCSKFMEMWHVHLHILQVNEKLEARLQKYKVAAGGNDMVERVLHLETELAEAMEANNMYKLQLRRYVWPAPFLAHHTWKVHCFMSHLVAVCLSSRDVVVLEDSNFLQETLMGQFFF